MCVCASVVHSTLLSRWSVYMEKGSTTCRRSRVYLAAIVHPLCPHLCVLRTRLPFHLRLGDVRFHHRFSGYSAHHQTASLNAQVGRRVGTCPMCNLEVASVTYRRLYQRKLLSNEAYTRQVL